MRQFTGDPEVWDNLAKEFAAEREAREKLEKKKQKKVFTLSLEDEAKVREFKSQKVQDIKDIPPRKQERIRRIINLERKAHNKPEIQYPNDINPNHSTYKPKLAQLIVNYYNDELEFHIHQLYDDKLYEHEFKKLEKYTQEKLQKKIQRIPHDVQHEIVQSLQLDPHNITIHKKEVQQKIVAIFNSFY